MPTWPFAAIILLMTSVFGLSVAVWCGELELSKRDSPTPATIDRLEGLGVQTSGSKTIRPTRIATIVDENENGAHQASGTLAPLRAVPVNRSTSDSEASKANLADSHQLAIPLASQKDSTARQPQTDLVSFSIVKPLTHRWNSTALVDRFKAAVEALLMQLAAADRDSRERLRAPDEPLLNGPSNASVTCPREPTDHATESSECVDPRSDDAEISRSTNSTTPEPAVVNAWPPPNSLLNQLGELEKSLGHRPWQADVKRLLFELADVSAIDDPQVKTLLEDLARAADQLWDESRSIVAAGTSVDDRTAAANLSRISYDLHRQVRLWQLVHRFSTSADPRLAPETTAAQSVAFNRWTFEQVDPQWRAYLGLDLFESGGPEMSQAARTILSRLHSVGLDSSQREFVRQVISPELERDLRRAATNALDLNQFLVDVEAFHRHANGYTQSRLNDHYQSCLWSGSAQDLAMAQVLEDHYRNANIRFAISESFMNQFLARPRSANEPVRDQILGANVSGRSQITNQLGVQLVPDDRQWSLVLTTKGNVLSRTQAHRDGFVIHSVGNANVVGSKRLSVSYDGVTSEAPQVEAITDNQVIGLDSPFDDIPMLGWTARRMAQRKQQAVAPIAEQIVRSRIRSRVQERMEQAVTDALQKAKTELDRLVVSRFVDWSLEPQPVEMSTTENDVVLRYRLAGFDQMAADTPRPSIDDQMAASLQLHESAVNNGLARLDLADASFTLETLLEHLRAKLKTNLNMPEENLHQVEISFAPYDPIRVDFADDSIVLTINLKRLKIDRGKNWRNVTVQTRFEVQFDGFYLTLLQAGGVRASGSQVRVRDEIAIGAIFDQILNDEYRFSLLPQEYEADFLQTGIRLAHIALADGWLSVAYDESPPSQDESRQTMRSPPRLR